MQPKQIHELLECFYKKPVKAVELVKKMLVSEDESTFSVWVENEKSNKFDSSCEMTWHSNKSNISQQNRPHLTIFCNTCGIVNSSLLCLPCYMSSNSKHSDNNNNDNSKGINSKKKYNNEFEELKLEPHPNHDVYFKFTNNGRCSCGDINSMDPNFFCPYHTLQPTNPPNVEIFGSDHCDFITDLTDICFRSLIVHAPHSTDNVECIVNFLLDLAHINSSYLHLIAAALSENFDSSALFTHWPQFLTKNALYIVKLIETLSADDSFQYAFTTSFFDNYIYLLSHDLNVIESINPSTTPTSTVPLLGAADIAWSYFINHEEMIEDFSIAELIGKEFYILTSFIRSDPFHPIIPHSLIRNFFNTMSTFFSSSDRFFKNLTSPESISKITDIYIDALTLETFPIVTKKYNFYDFEYFKHDFKYLYNLQTSDTQKKSLTNPPEKEEDINNNTNSLFDGQDNFSYYFNYEKEFECEFNPIRTSDKYSMDKHLIMRNFAEKIDPKYTFMRCALKFKKNLFCAIEHLSDLFQSPEMFIMPLLCGMIKTFFSTMSPDQFAFQNDFISTITCTDFNSSSNNNNKDINGNPNFNQMLSKNNENSNINDSNQARSSTDNNNESVAVSNLINIESTNSYSSRRKFSKPKNTLYAIHFTHYYESKEPFYFRSVLDDLTLISCSAPCHSITFRKFCKYSTNGTEDWRKALREANVFEIMFSNSSYLRNTFKPKANKDIESELDQKVKLYLEDIALLTITVIPIRICALSSLLSLEVTRIDNIFLKKQIIKSKNVNRNIQYDDFLQSILPKTTLTNITNNKVIIKNSKNYDKKGSSIKSFNDSDDDDDDDDANYNEDNENFDEYDEDNEYEEYEDIDESGNDEEDKTDSNYLYYNLFLKFADFSYDIIGSFAGSICALSFASNIGYLSLVTYCVFDLKNGITSKKLFAYLNFLICCVSDRSIYAKDDEKLCYFFIRNLLSKRGKMTGFEILKECDKFFSKHSTFLYDRDRKYPNTNEDDCYFISESNNDASDLLFDDNDYEDNLIESKMKGKQIDDLDTFELLSGKSHSFSEKISNRFSRPIIHKILSEIAEPVKDEKFNYICFKLRDEFNDFRPSIFNTAKESFDQWSTHVQKHPNDAFMRVSFDNDYKPSGFSPQSVLLTPEFYSILFITALEANNPGSEKFDKETIQIYFAILHYIRQFNYFFEISETKIKNNIKKIKADNLNELIKLLPNTFLQFQVTPIKYKNYPETTFNDILLKFGETGQIFLRQTNNKITDQINPETKKPDFSTIFYIYKQKQMNYFDSFVDQFKIQNYFSPTKSIDSTSILNTIPILVFDGYSGRQIWTSSSAINEIQQKITFHDENNNVFKEEDHLVFNNDNDLYNKNAWLPINLNPSFESLMLLIDNELLNLQDDNSYIELFINQFGFFNPEKNLFNIIHCTIENVELRLRSNPFALDDARPRILLGNSFRILWAFAQKKLKQKKNIKYSQQTQNQKEPTKLDQNLNDNQSANNILEEVTDDEKLKIVIDRTFNYRNNELWNECNMSDKTTLSPITNRLTLLLSILLISEKPSESFTDLLNFIFNFGQTNRNENIFEYKGIEFIINNFNEFENEENELKDDFYDLIFLRCSFIVAYCCLWSQIESPNSLFDPESKNSISDLCSLLLKNNISKDIKEEKGKHHFNSGINFFSFVDLPNNFFAFSEFPFVAEIMRNNNTTNKHKNNDLLLSSSSSSSLLESEYCYYNHDQIDKNIINEINSNNGNICNNDNDNNNNNNKNNINDNNNNCESQNNINNQFDKIDNNSNIDSLTNNNILIDNYKYLSCKNLSVIKKNEKTRLTMKKNKANLFSNSEAIDLISGKVDDYDSLIAKSDSNCSILISLDGEDAGLCYAYNKSLNIENKQVSPVYLTLFGEAGISSGELLYLNKDKVLKLEDSFLSGEIFL